MVAPRFTFVGVPIDSVGRCGGTEFAPDAIREVSGDPSLWSADVGNLEVSIRGDDRDPDTGIIASADVLRTTAVVEDAVAHILEGGDTTPFVMGGCCTLMPGALAGSRRVLGPTALVYVDGHLDLYDGNTSPSGEAADMPMSVVLGLGPAAWVEACGGRVVDPSHAAIVGFRDLEEAIGYGHPRPQDIAGLTAIDADGVRAGGGRAVGGELVEGFREPGRLWVHLDVDVLDETVFPATDYLMPGGLGWQELTELLGPLLTSPSLVGVSVGCYNPTKDPGAEAGRALVEAFREAVSG
ncbi:MAG: arginase family protein [Actinobacteria bacterium]|nr:arginase family protein [Actinomycetota bacterium]